MSITRRTALGATLAALPSLAYADALSDILNGVVKSQTGGANLGGGLNFTEGEAAQGLKAALSNGVVAAVTRVGRLDGYWADGTVRVPLPRTLEKARTFLAPLGQSGILDDLHLRLNRGAEKAAPAAKSIFLDALRGMSIQDAIGIVRGPQNSATLYFQERTTPALTSAFRPGLTSALNGSGAFRVADNVDRRLAGIPLAGIAAGGQTTSTRQMLIDHGLDWGLKGLFHYIGAEEAAIRSNPVKRTSAILRKVFGG